jgi:hypothetical protein
MDNKTWRYIEKTADEAGPPVPVRLSKNLDETTKANRNRCGLASQIRSTSIQSHVLAIQVFLLLPTHAGFLLCLLFNPEDGSEIFLRNIG